MTSRGDAQNHSKMVSRTRLPLRYSIIVVRGMIHVAGFLLHLPPVGNEAGIYRRREAGMEGGRSCVQLGARWFVSERTSVEGRRFICEGSGGDRRFVRE